MSHAAEFDEYGHKDHGHVIVSIFTLRFVLAALLVCTLATSGAAWAENAIAATFHVEIPQWINAAVALSIAVLKTFLVVTFFMQLKYDNPMNTIIFVFTILTVFSFLGFTSLDLNNRDTIDRFKNQYAYDGGDLSAGAGPIFKEDVVPGESIVERAKRIARVKQGDFEALIAKDELKIAALNKENGNAAEHGKEIAALRREIEETRERMVHEGYDPHHEHHFEEGLDITDMGFVPEAPRDAEHHLLSSTNVSRPVEGVTIPGLPGYRAPQVHGEHPAHATPAGEKKGEGAGHSDEAKPETKNATEHAPNPPTAPAAPATSPASGKPH